MYSFAEQSIPLEGVVNARDLGGYVLPDGRRIKKGLLLRGGSLAGATKADLQLLSEKYHLAHVFDFRTEGEVTFAPDKAVPGSDNVWLPAIDPQTETKADMALPKEAYRDLPRWVQVHAGEPLVQLVASRIYTDMVTNEYTQLQYAAFLQTIINTPEGAMYWHCSQGKDRTGLGAAFLLCALGADRQLIMDDYLVSADYYKEDVNTLFEKVTDILEREVVRTFIGVNPRYFSAALDLIDKRYGSMQAYLEGPLCVLPSDMKLLQDRYLEQVH